MTAGSESHGRDSGIRAAVVFSQQQLLPIESRKVSAANKAPAGMELFALSNFESGAFQHAAEKQGGVGANVGWVKPEYFAHDGQVLGVRRDDYQLPARTQDPAAQFNQARGAFKIHVLDDMAAKYAAKFLRCS